MATKCKCTCPAAEASQRECTDPGAEVTGASDSKGNEIQ
jgi:hypothetical protein